LKLENNDIFLEISDSLGDEQELLYQFWIEVFQMPKLTAE
jgi:hypothetical protein